MEESGPARDTNGLAAAGDHIEFIECPSLTNRQRCGKFFSVEDADEHESTERVWIDSRHPVTFRVEGAAGLPVKF